LSAVAGASQIVVVGGPKARLDLARSWGASHVIDVSEVPDAASRRDLVLDMTSGRGADIVIEVSGVVPAFTEGMDLIRPGGRYLIIGQGHTELVPFNPSQIVFKQVTLIGSLSAGVDHYWKSLEFLRRHADRFRWDEMISNQYPLDSINEAFERMSRWQEIKPAIAFA
jgi:L-iditol 2-dehydrogenase